MPNVIVHLSKYFWAVGSFGGVPSANAFTKWYMLHYQPKKVETNEGILFAQYGCLNFHTKRDNGPKPCLAIKKQVVVGVDEILVLLSGPVPPEL
jgi:hypothetical protein